MGSVESVWILTYTQNFGAQKLVKNLSTKNFWWVKNCCFTGTFDFIPNFDQPLVLSVTNTTELLAMEIKIVHCTMDGWDEYWILLVHFLWVSCKSQSNRQCVKDLKLQCHSKGNYSVQRNGFLSLDSAAFSLAVRTNARQRGFYFVSVIMSYKSWSLESWLH